MPTEPRAGAGTVSVLGVAAPSEAPGPAMRRARRSSRHRRDVWAVRAVVAAAAVAGSLVEVSPSGTGWADRVLAAGFVALCATAGAAAKRWTWFVAAGAALALADERLALVGAAAALGLALLSTGPVRPAPAVGAAVGALAGLALLGADDIGFHGSSALLTAAATAPLLASGYRHAGQRAQRRGRLAVAAGAGVALGICGAYVVAAASARSPAERGVEQLRLGVAAARAGDDDEAIARLDEAADAFGEADDRLGSWYAAPARVLPVVGHNARAAETMAAAAADVSRDGTDAALAADIDTLTVVDGRLDLDRVRALQGPLAGVAGVLAAADDDLAVADTSWLLPPVADQLDRVRDEVTDVRPDVDVAVDAASLVPALFGGEGAARWLVAFVTPVEARGRTGFMGNFAELTAVDGDVEMTRFGRTSELESGGTPGPDRVLTGPDDYLARWARFEPATTWRNVTMSPDFPSVGQVLTELYPQSGGQPVDGVIAVDPVGLAALMRFTGPIRVPGRAEPLTADTAADYLLRDQYLAGDNEARIDTLEDLSRATFDRLTTGDLPGPGEIADVLAPVVRAGHIHVYASEADQQAMFADLGVDGALPAVVGDTFGVVTNNAIGNKIDLFLQRDLDYAVRWDPATGAVDATATVTLTNSAPASGLPGYVIGSSLPAEDSPPRGTNRSYVSVYSPWELDAARLDRAPVEIERQDERGRFAYSLFVDVPPAGGTRTLTLELHGQIPRGADYVLDVTTQPLVTPDRLDVAVQVVGRGGVEAGAPLAADGQRAVASLALTDEVTRFGVEAAS